MFHQASHPQMNPYPTAPCSFLHMGVHGLLSTPPPQSTDVFFPGPWCIRSAISRAGYPLPEPPLEIPLLAPSEQQPNGHIRLEMMLSLREEVQRREQPMQT